MNDFVKYLNDFSISFPEGEVNKYYSPLKPQQKITAITTIKYSTTSLCLSCYNVKPEARTETANKSYIGQLERALDTPDFGVRFFTFNKLFNISKIHLLKNILCVL